MKLPNDYKLYIVPEDSKHLKLNDIQRSGICNMFEEIIYIADNLRKRVLREVIAHEIVHALISRHIPGREVVDDEEWICNFMGLYAFEVVELTNYVLKRVKIKDGRLVETSV
jgi:hypothetical protein